MIVVLVLLLCVCSAFGQTAFTFDIASFPEAAAAPGGCPAGTNNVQWLPTSSVVTWYDASGNTHNGETQPIFNTNPVCNILRLDMSDVDWTNHNVNTLTNLRRFEGVASDGGSNWVFDLSNLYVLTNANIYFHTNLYTITITGCTNLQDVNFSANRTLTNIAPSTTAFLRFTNLVANDCSNLLASSQEKLSVALSNMVYAVARSNGTVDFSHCPGISSDGESALLFLSNYAWTVTYTVGTNNVMWWTNTSSTGYLIDPRDADLALEEAFSVAARGCTNMWSLIGGLTTNFIFNNLTALTNLQMTTCDLPLVQSKALWQLLVDNGGSNANAAIYKAVPDPEAITNAVILSDRGNSIYFYNPGVQTWFAPINTAYTINGVSVYVGDALGIIPSDIGSIARGSDVHRFITPIGDMSSLTNADFNGDGFDQGTIDQVLSDIANSGAPNGGFLDLQNMVAPTDGYSNADYQTLTNNGWTVLLTP